MAERRDEQDQREEHLCQLGANWVSEQRDGDEAVKIDKPDSRIRNSKAIDYVARDSIGSIAVEHTKIEPFIGEFTDSRRTIGFFDGFSERFGASLPTPGWYELCVMPGAVDGLTGKNATKALDHLEAWVRATAPKLAVHGPLVRGGYRRAEYPDVPFEVTLYRWGNDSRTSGQLFYGRATERNGESNRIERIGRALDDKCWKLEQARETGWVTVLVLETADIQTTNSIVVARAVRMAAEARSILVRHGKPFPLPDFLLTVDAFDKVEVIRWNGRWSEAALSERSEFERG